MTGKGRPTNRWAENIKAAMKSWMHHKRSVMSLAVIVVFVTTYMLVLPAVTLDNETADQTPGIETENVVENVPAEDQPGVEEPASEEAKPQKTKTEKVEKQEAKPDKERSGGSEKKDSKKAAEKNVQDDEIKLLSEKKKIESKANGYKIVCECGADTKLPADVRLKVKEVKKAEDVSDSDIEESKVTGESGREYNSDDLEKKAGETVDIGENAQMKLLDISFRSDDMTAAGEEGGLDPKSPVKVKAAFEQYTKISGTDPVRVVAFDIDKDELQAKTIAADLDTEKNEIAFDASRSTIYGLIYSVADTKADPEEDTNADAEDAKGGSKASAENKEVAESSSDDEKADDKDSDKGENLKKTVISADGDAYSVTVTYGSDAGVPEGAGLSVEEITDDEKNYDDYVARTENALGWKEGAASYARLFDIKIVDVHGDKVTIQAPVDVKIELADSEAGSEVRLVHFADGSAKGDIVSNVDMQNGELSFEAGSFSVYSIVEGPSEVPTPTIRTVRDPDELAANTDSAFYMSLTRGSTQFVTDELNGSSAFKVTTTRTSAAEWFFEPTGTDGQYLIYTMQDGAKKYMKNTSGNLMGLVDTNGTVFEVSRAADGLFYIKVKGQNKWLQYSNGGTGIRLYTDNNNAQNSRFAFTYAASYELPDDPYGLDGKTYGIGYQNGETNATALGTNAKTVSNTQRLSGDPMMVRRDVLTNSGFLLVSQNSDITEWTFRNVKGDKYYITAMVDGAEKYLTLRGNDLTLEDQPADDGSSEITVTSGTGANKGDYRFSVGTKSINLPNGKADWFNTANGAGSTTWMKLLKKSENLTEDDFHLYTAKKVSVSDTESVYTGQKVIVYTRVWNSEKSKYDFYAVDHDGTLIPCTDAGDTIQWVGSKVNTALWDFTEYMTNGKPNNYYELVNTQYEEKCMAPQMTDDQVIREGTFGINLNGRRYGKNFTTIIAWDDAKYDYAGMKVDMETGKVVPCRLDEAEDFYFAVMDEEEPSGDDKLTTVKTIDSDQYGISMKMIDYNTVNSSNRATVQATFFNGDNNNPGLLSTNLKDNGYPDSTSVTGSAGNSLAGLYSQSTDGSLKDVNHLFIESIYNESGYFEYDSTQNFSHLNDDGTFTVYDQIGTMTGGGDEFKPTRTHGQFMPYDEIEEGQYAIAKNGQIITNTTDVLAKELPDTDPRKDENLYLIGDAKDVDYFFGMEMEASFTQTASGLDAWGHDIIFEFSGDDDFWFYVDGELVLDLGGVHSAMVGSINFRTGEVKSSRGNSTLYEIFKKNYQTRGLSEEEIATKLDEIFELKDGNYVFKDYSNHKMKMFYMERGAGSSNLHMRFNLAAVRPGTFILSKKLSGTDDPANSLVEVPYQIYYTSDKDGAEHLLTEKDAEGKDRVTYEGTSTAVKYKPTYTSPGGAEYSNVFFIKPGESAEVALPDDAVDYYVRECAVDTGIYNAVKANGDTLTGKAVSGGGEGVCDFDTSKASSEDRPKLEFDNHVDPDAVRSLTITKQLYDENGEDLVNYRDNKTPFVFRLYLGSSDTEGAIPPADMYKYHVKDAEGYYCRYDETNGFVSIGKKNYADLTDEQKKNTTFTTSSAGTISKIPADHTVEVRDLIAGTRFKVEERQTEIPKGYTMRLLDGYQRVDEGHETSGTTPISGSIEKKNDPDIIVNNQKGWGLTVKKNWTDADFMESHDPVYFAVYIEKADGSFDLVDGTVRKLESPETQVYYFFNNLQSGVPFSKYHVFEVELTGDDITTDDEGNVTGYSQIKRIADGEKTTVGGTPVGGTHVDGNEYTVSYEQGQQTTQNENVRTDKATNSRPGIRILKTDMDGEYMAGAVFTLKYKGGDKDGQNVAAESYKSDENGLVTTAYLSAGEYTLTETKAPKGYVAPDGPLTITVDEDGNVTVTPTVEDDAELFDVQTGGSSGSSGGSMKATITVKNRTTSLTSFKKDAVTGDPVSGVHFALYRQVKDNEGHLVKDYDPMPGFEDLVTNGNGVIPKINMDLNPGTYYLTETQAAEKYAKLMEDVCLTIGADGTVTINSDGHSGWLTAEESGSGQGGTKAVAYAITVPNSRTSNVQIMKTDPNGQTISTGASFALYTASDYDDESEQPKSGAKAIVTGRTGTDGLLSLGDLPIGEYRLVETEAPAGYNRAAGAIKIYVTAGTSEAADNTVTAMQANQPSEVTKITSQGEVTWRIPVWNDPGAELPASGGPGTKWMYLLGSLLTLAAGIALVSRRRFLVR